MSSYLYCFAQLFSQLLKVQGQRGGTIGPFQTLPPLKRTTSAKATCPSLPGLPASMTGLHGSLKAQYHWSTQNNSEGSSTLQIYCEWKMLPATSVSKGCCSHQTIILQLPWPGALRELRMETGCTIKPSATSVTPSCASWGDTEWENIRYWPQIAEVHM